jgi:hypothetical protein
MYTCTQYSLSNNLLETTITFFGRGKRTPLKCCACALSQVLRCALPPRLPGLCMAGSLSARMHLCDLSSHTNFLIRPQREVFFFHM